MQIKNDKRERRIQIKKAALSAAEARENIADIINNIVSEMIKQRFELPSFKSLLRIAYAARKVINYNYYRKINSMIGNKNKKLIDLFFDAEGGNKELSTLRWAELKKEPKSPTHNNIKDFSSYLNEMRKYQKKLNINFGFIPPTRLEQLMSESLAADASDMKKMLPMKRYALAAILIHMKTATAIDDLASAFIIWIRNIHTKGKNNLALHREEHMEETDNLILILYQMINAMKDNKGYRNKVRAIEGCIKDSQDKILEQCVEHLAYANDNYFSFMLNPYKNKRHIIFQLLNNFTIYSTTQNKFIEEALSFIKFYQPSREKWLNIRELKYFEKFNKLNLNAFSDKWYKLITGNSTREMAIHRIHRHYFELATFTEIARDLDCGDAYIADAYNYNDPNKQLISWKQFYKEVDDYCALAKIPKDADEFVKFFQKKLRNAAEIVDNHYQTNAYLTIENKIPIIKKAPSKKEPPELEKIKKLMANKMPLKTIVEVIIDIEKELNLSQHFRPLSGFDSKIRDYSSRFIATTFAFGCNVGATQAERSLLKYTRKQIAWIFNHHVTEQRLNKAIEKLNNKFIQFELPKKWGTGKSSSVDGTFIDMLKQNLLAAHHIRYGDYGGIGYYHVSDLYIALFSNFISCGVHEGAYLFDGIIENESHIKPHRVHGDTAAQSELLFGFSPLISVEIMPRIRNFKNLLYYKASKEDKYKFIDEIFSEQTIHWETIKTYYHDMLRMAISIRNGKIKASTILRKFNSKSRKNKLYFAFRELGRVTRTIFLLNYIHDPNLRRIINAATCKSEEFNNFIAWISFGDGGIIGDNKRYNQQKIVKYSHLVANMVIFHNVAHLTKAINELREEGVEISEDVLECLAPYWTEHINRLGLLPLNMEDKTPRIEYELLRAKK